MITIITLVSIVGGIFLALWRLMHTYKSNVDLKNTVEEQKKEIQYQNEVIKKVTNHSTLDDTIDSLHNGNF